MKPVVNIFWFRRDLRIDDNAGLYHALRAGQPVVPVFIFDTEILDELEDKVDRRVEFIYEALGEIQGQLAKLGSTLDVRYGSPLPIFRKLIADYQVDSVYTNHDYEPYARSRDELIRNFLQQHGISFHSYKDQVIFEQSEVVKDDSRPYLVFTPYSRTWMARLNEFYLRSFPTRKYAANFLKQPEIKWPTLAEMGFSASEKRFPSARISDELIRDYDKHRDFPAIAGTTRLSVHLRFGTISIRKLATEALALNNVFLKELTWRDFYQMILWHFPEVVHQSFKPEYDKIRWRNNDQEFEAWCKGETGYPIVDAGMRELNETGFMHNRVRMITASFLTKHLLVDWRWGEAYFARKLLDYDLAANNGGWQWAAGSGCDAAPYFRIFNPTTQTKKFDAELKYVRKWVPEFEDFSYPKPIVDHDFARKRCLAAYQQALKK